MKVVSREEIENLVKMANRLDEEGRVAEVVERAQGQPLDQLKHIK